MTVKSRETLEQYVERGMRRYDVIRPGWVHLIDLESFDIAHQGACVVGQVDGYYDDHIDAVLEAGVEDWQYGFNVEADYSRPFTEDMQEWELLQEVWVTKLTERMGA